MLVTATIQLSSESSWNEKWIEHLHDSRGHFVRCKICVKYPDIMKRYAHNNRIPPIASKEGVRYRLKILENHFATDYHKESVKADRSKSLQLQTLPVLTPMDIYLNKANKLEANHVGKLLIQVYTDAKRLTLSAWNWPARYVASEASHAFSITNEGNTTIPPNVSLQYVNNKAHLELMTCIVESDVGALKTKIDRCLSISLRIDGSVDRTQIDKIYVLAKIITSAGVPELLFLGVNEQVERLANGLFKTALGAIEKQFGRDFLYDVILKKVSSICTDGTNVNSGEHGGLWALLEEEISKNGSEIPLLKIWCAAHRSDLAFNDLSTAVPESSKILSILSRISSYFHTSAVRSSELKKIASSIGLALLSMPKIFTVRWTQFTYQLVRAISHNWHAIALYFREQGDAQSKGFYKYVTNIENLKKLAFLGDVLFVFQRFQKRLQSDSLTILGLSTDVANVIETLQSLKEVRIPSGFETKLQAKIVTENEKQILQDIELEIGISSSRRLTEDTEMFRENVLDSLMRFLQKRFQIGTSELISALEAFLKFDKPAGAAVELEKIGIPRVPSPNGYPRSDASAQTPLKQAPPGNKGISKEYSRALLTRAMTTTKKSK